jgi:hypothetical protein
MDGTSAVVRMTPGRDRRRRAEIHPDDYLRAVSATRLNRALKRHGSTSAMLAGLSRRSRMRRQIIGGIGPMKLARLARSAKLTATT